MGVQFVYLFVYKYQYFCSLYSFGLYPLIIRPIRIITNSGILVYNTFTSELEYIVL